MIASNYLIKKNPLGNGLALGIEAAKLKYLELISNYQNKTNEANKAIANIRNNQGWQESFAQTREAQIRGAGRATEQELIAKAAIEKARAVTGSLESGVTGGSLDRLMAVHRIQLQQNIDRASVNTSSELNQLAQQEAQLKAQAENQVSSIEASRPAYVSPLVGQLMIQNVMEQHKLETYREPNKQGRADINYKGYSTSPIKLFGKI